jgi:hypothetical protein
MRHGPLPEAPADRAQRARRWAYTAVGVAGFLAWFLMVAAEIFPIGTQLQVDAQALRLADQIRQCRRQLGHEAASLSDCPQVAVPRDPWGTPLRYRPLDSGFEISSAGRDRAFGTADDFTFRYR